MDKAITISIIGFILIGILIGILWFNFKDDPEPAPTIITNIFEEPVKTKFFLEISDHNDNRVSGINYRVETNDTVIANTVSTDARAEFFANITLNDTIEISVWSNSYYYNHTTCIPDKEEYNNCQITTLKKGKASLERIGESSEFSSLVELSVSEGAVYKPLLCVAYPTSIRVFTKYPLVSIPKSFSRDYDKCFQMPTLINDEEVFNIDSTGYGNITVLLADTSFDEYGNIIYNDGYIEDIKINIFI